MWPRYINALHSLVRSLIKIEYIDDEQVRALRLKVMKYRKMRGLREIKLSTVLGPDATDKSKNVSQ